MEEVQPTTTLLPQDLGSLLSLLKEFNVVEFEYQGIKLKLSPSVIQSNKLNTSGFENKNDSEEAVKKDNGLYGIWS